MGLTVEDPLAHRALEGLLRAEAAVRRRLSADLEREGMSAPGFYVLVVLVTAGGELELKNLRARLRIPKPPPPGFIDPPSPRAPAPRRRTPGDRRQLLITVTALGAEMV